MPKIRIPIGPKSKAETLTEELESVMSESFLSGRSIPGYCRYDSENNNFVFKTGMRTFTTPAALEGWKLEAYMKLFGPTDKFLGIPKLSPEGYENWIDFLKANPDKDFECQLRWPEIAKICNQGGPNPSATPFWDTTG
jgi:hypothetical protein